MVGFLKVGRLDLALSRRIFAGDGDEETAAAVSGRPRRADVYFFYCLVKPANGRSGGGYRLTIKRRGGYRLTIKRRGGYRLTIKRGGGYRLTIKRRGGYRLTIKRRGGSRCTIKRGGGYG
jgi:hypothetical protein